MRVGTLVWAEAAATWVGAPAIDACTWMVLSCLWGLVGAQLLQCSVPISLAAAATRRAVEAPIDIEDGLPTDAPLVYYTGTPSPSGRCLHSPYHTKLHAAVCAGRRALQHWSMLLALCGQPGLAALSTLPPTREHLVVLLMDLDPQPASCPRLHTCLPRCCCLMPRPTSCPRLHTCPPSCPRQPRTVPPSGGAAGCSAGPAGTERSPGEPC